MKLEKKTTQDVNVFEISGRLDATNSRELEDAIRSFVGEDALPLVLDMSTLEYISSAGLRVLIIAAKLFKEKDLKLALCSLQANVKNVMEIAGFLQLFKIFDSAEEAAAAVA